MRKALCELLQSLATNQRILETFKSLQSGGKTFTTQELIKKNPTMVIISIIVIELLVLCFGKWLWNNIVIKLIDGVKPAKSIWQILGLSILIKLLTN